MTESTIKRFKKIYDVDKNDGRIREIVYSHNVRDYSYLMTRITETKKELT